MISQMQITIILDDDVLAALDRAAAAAGMGRSAWLDRWLADELGLPPAPTSKGNMRGGAAVAARRAQAQSGDGER